MCSPSAPADSLLTCGPSSYAPRQAELVSQFVGAQSAVVLLLVTADPDHRVDRLITENSSQQRRLVQRIDGCGLLRRQQRDPGFGALLVCQRGGIDGRLRRQWQLSLDTVERQ